MKTCRICTIVFLLLTLLTCGAQAANTANEVLTAQSEALDLHGLEQAAEEYGGGQAITPDTGLEEGIQSILNTGSDEMFGVVRKAVRSGVLLLAVVLLCALADGMKTAGHLGGGIDVVSVAGALAVTAVAAADVNTLVGLGREALDKMDMFSKVLLPTITAAAAASGAPSSSAARQLATVLFSDVLMTLITRLLIPLVYAYIAASAAYAALGNEGLKRVGGVLKWVVTTVLMLVLIIFVGSLTVSGAIAGTADAATVKAAKFAVSSVVPVVGGILSDAAETVLVGASVLRNTVGVFGMLTVLGICLVPFLQLGIHYLAYKLTAALTGTISAGRVTGLIDSIGGAFGLVLGMTGACAILMLVSIVSAISVVTI